MMLEEKNHSKYHFRAYNFQNFPGGMPPDPLDFRQLLYTSVTLNLVQPGPSLPNFLGTSIIWPHHQLGSSYATDHHIAILQFQLASYKRIPLQTYDYFS